MDYITPLLWQASRHAPACHLVAHLHCSSNLHKQRLHCPQKTQYAQCAVRHLTVSGVLQGDVTNFNSSNTYPDPALYTFPGQNLTCTCTDWCACHPHAQHHDWVLTLALYPAPHADAALLAS